MDISTVSNQVSNIALEKIGASAGIAALKKSINVEVQAQMSLIGMLNDITPHLGQNIDVMA